MDQKKRRNSILKKPPTTDEETTTDITTKIKRRISFSGKKSVKEFLAGEEQATIWGTSYEESAECLHACTTVESGVIAVNDKRIVLRNRRVVVEQNRSNKRRSKPSKKVNVAENDKENVFIPTTQVESEHPTNSIEVQKKENSPVKSELAIVKNHVQSNTKARVDQRDSLNACSTTFDFINYSGAINKTVTIEQSVEVSLDDDELQMFKFRVPVSAAEVSPNLSLERDGSSPNIFSGSILMSHEDMNMLKSMKVQMGGLISKGEPRNMIEAPKITTNNTTVTESTELHSDNKNPISQGISEEGGKENSHMGAITRPESMEIACENVKNKAVEIDKALESKSLKRKTITAPTQMDDTIPWTNSYGKSHRTLVDTVTMDVHSPMRKKPMHHKSEQTMDISVAVFDHQQVPSRRQTIHFESATIDEVGLDEGAVCVRKNERQTILFDQNQIHEDTICREDDTPTGAEDDHTPMEVSLVEAEVKVDPVKDTTATTTKKRQSIHGPVDILEDSPKKVAENVQTVENDKLVQASSQRKSIYTPVDIPEDSPKQTKSSHARRQSVHIPTDMVEESPKPKVHQSQSKDNANIAQEVPMQCIPPIASTSESVSKISGKASSVIRRTIVAVVDMVFDGQSKEQSCKGRQSVYTPTDIVEEKECVQHKYDDSKDESSKARTTKETMQITKPADRSALVRDQSFEIMDDSFKLEETRTTHEKSKTVPQGRKSIYTPSDMIEDSPKTQKTLGSENSPPSLVPKRGANDRKSIYTALDMDEDLPKVQKMSENPKSSEVLRKKGTALGRMSVYTPSDMIEDSPKTHKTSDKLKPSVVCSKKGRALDRMSIYTPSDMIEDSPKTQKLKENQKPQGATGIRTDLEDLPTTNETIPPPSHQSFIKSATRERKSIYTATDMVEDSPKATKTNAPCPSVGVQDRTGSNHGRKSIYTPSDMVEDSPEDQSNQRPVETHVHSFRKPICMSSDIVEDTNNKMQDNRHSSTKRQSIYTCVDMVEDSPEFSEPSQRQTSAFEASSNKTLNQTSARQNFSVKESASKAPTAQSTSFGYGGRQSGFEKNTNKSMSLRTSALQETLSKAVHSQTIYEPVDILEHSPPKLPAGNIQNKGNVTQKSMSTVDKSKSLTQQVSKTQPSVCKPENRKTISAPSDIVEDSPSTKVRHSIYTPVDIMEDSPKQSSPKKTPSVVSAPKIVVRHMTIQQGVMGTDAAMRILKNQQNKAKAAVQPVQCDESVMDISVAESVPFSSAQFHESTTRPNFCKLNEQLLRGEVKAFADENKNKKSLFDRIEMVGADDLQFDSFQKKPAGVTECLMQPKKGLIDDYTLELTRNVFDGQKRRGTDYTMNLSSRLNSKVEPLDEEKQSNNEARGDTMNVSLQLSPISGGDQFENAEVSRLASKSANSKRQTIHFHNENEMDVSQELARSPTKRQTIHFNQHFELEKTSTQIYTNRAAFAGLEDNPRTIHFNQNNEIDETKLEKTSTKIYPNRAAFAGLEDNPRTIHFNQNNEIDETKLEKTSTKIYPNRAPFAGLEDNPRTIHFNENNEIEETKLEKTSTQIYPNRAAFAGLEDNPRTIHFNENNEIEETKQYDREYQTARDMSAMDVSAKDDDVNDEINVEPKNNENFTRQSCIVRTSLLHATTKSEHMPAPNRQTICAPAPILEVTIDHKNAPHTDTMDLSTSFCPPSTDVKSISKKQFESKSKRRTQHCNDDVELDDTGVNCPSLAHVSQKVQQAASVICDSAPSIEESNAKDRQRVSAIPTRSAFRKTIHLNQDLDLEDITTEKTTESVIRPAIRKTIYFQESVEMDDEIMDRPGTNKTVEEPHSKEDVSKVLPKPRRMTTFEEMPLEIDEPTEKFDTRKSSFSRTLKFDEIPKATSKFQSVEQRDSPLLRYNTKLRRCESTTEIDRSLAEYLKAEAAATQYQRTCSPESMVMEETVQSPQSEYYDAEGEQMERDEFNVEEKTHLKQAHILEESGMQPLQRTASRRDIEQYLPDKAVEGPDPDQSDMSFELRGVQANRMNHEFFDKELSMSPKPAEPELRNQAKVRRQTILQPEAMMEESEDGCVESTSPKRPVESNTVNSQPSRKTIHFTNENAVDESFFDENLSKPPPVPKIPNKRGTVYFNESQNSIDNMDTSGTEHQSQSQTIGRSKAAQSMKEILRESNMLFTQSMLKPHFLETKRPTVYFDAKDISLDTNEDLKQDETVESTPTKANKSRIPQLIGSAKKLQSMKKSMEFIQRKLPILSSSVHAVDEDTLPRDVDRAAEISKDEASFSSKPKELQTSFDTSPQQVEECTAENPKDQASLSCKPKMLENSLETVEIPRKLVTSQPVQLQESFETVEIPRRATTFQRNDTLYLCQNEVDITNISQKSNYRFEDVPITISDVSTYFAQNPPPKEIKYSPNTTEALCNLDMNKFGDETQLPKSSDSEDTAYNIGKFKKRYVELTCDSINSTGLNEDIEKTHLSLVNTLDEGESELVRETCPDLVQLEVAPTLDRTNFSRSVCRSCKRHKQTVSQNDTTLSSFVLAPLPEYKMDLDALKELSSKPRVFDVAKNWRQNLRESDSFNLSDGRFVIDLEDDDTMDNFMASLEKERRMLAQRRQRKEFKQETSFVFSVRKKLQSKKSNWILNDLLLTQNILKFTHTRIRTFAIFIRFTHKDPRGVDVEFNEMRVVPNVLHSRVWTAFDYALHYQLLVELPFDLSTLCPKSENLFQLLEHVETVTQDVLKIGKDMLYLILSSPASLIREPSGGIYIRKYTRTRTAQNEVKRTEFQIEVRNMKRLSYESITQPPLYEFDEKIQLLPTGQDFLRVFLADPLRYMKA